MSNEKEQLNNIENAATFVFKKYLRSIKLTFIGILAAVIISLTPINTSKLPESDKRPTVVNGHLLEPENKTEETDIYVDGSTQQRRLNPKPKVIVISKEEFFKINPPKT